MFNTDNVAHPNSLLFNAFPLFWPLKLYWFFRKVSVREVMLIIDQVTYLRHQLSHK